MLIIDTIDRRILAILQADCTLSMDAIAERVSLSRNAVWRRIRQMEDSGLIRGRVALLDPDALDLGLDVIMMVRTTDHRPDWLDRFARALKDFPEIQGAYRMTGDLDYLIRARVRDVKAYDALYQRLTRRVDLADVSASFVMEELKDTTALPL
jgi:Lrp/AsnC family transcriptional regulator